MEVKQTSTGKTKADCELVDENGVEISKVSLWSDFPDFANLKPGSEVNGDLVKAKDPKYGPTLYPAKTYSQWKPKPKADIPKMMEAKKESIQQFQEVKNDSIKVAGAQRDATLMVTTFYKIAEDGLNPTDEMLKTKWQMWKSYFLGQSDAPF
ncbi:MAG: hypothetical protein PHN89_04805 [Candidatus Pacebacteria bacterium]|nr:hypothetical protein [Candidatus Paceibacterota bacterium]